MPTTTGIKCYHCKGRHDTVAEVKSCSAKRTPEQTSRYSNLSPGQQDFLRDLLKQFGYGLAGNETVETVSYAEGRRVLTALRDARRDGMVGREWTPPTGIVVLPKSARPTPRTRTPTRPPMPYVEPGFYAIPGKLLGYDKNDLYFYRVVEKGDRVFVNAIIGGKPEYGMKFTVMRKVLQAILDFGVEDAGVLFATKLKKCRNCGIHLTKYASRTLLYGPDCAEQKGLGDDWRALDWKARQEGLDDEEDN